MSAIRLAARGGDEAISGISRFRRYIGRFGDDVDDTRFLSSRTGKATALGGVGGAGYLGYRQQSIAQTRQDARRAEARNSQLENVPEGLRGLLVEDWTGNSTGDGLLEQIRDGLGLGSIQQTIILLIVFVILLIYLFNQANPLPDAPVSIGGAL